MPTDEEPPPIDLEVALRQITRVREALATLGPVLAAAAAALQPLARYAAALSEAGEPDTAPHGVRFVAVCGRCTRRIRPDVWSKWVDEYGGRTCGGDRTHVPAGLEGL